MKELVKKIEETMDVFKANAEAQVAKGNKAAGARARTRRRNRQQNRVAPNVSLHFNLAHFRFHLAFLLKDT